MEARGLLMSAYLWDGAFAANAISECYYHRGQNSYGNCRDQHAQSSVLATTPIESSRGRGRFKRPS